MCGSGGGGSLGGRVKATRELCSTVGAVSVLQKITTEMWWQVEDAAPEATEEAKALQDRARATIAVLPCAPTPPKHLALLQGVFFSGGGLQLPS